MRLIEESGTFDGILEQDAAKLLLNAALNEGVAHAYLFHGPDGVGKLTTALAFAAAILGDTSRVLRRSHPDLYVLEPLGDQIRIGDIHALRRDLSLRPFEGSRRVYIIEHADSMNPDATDALLKSLEEPPLYATLVLLADRLTLLSETIRSRCQVVPFRSLSKNAISVWLSEQSQGISDFDLLSRASGGTLEKARRFLDPEEVTARCELLELIRSIYRDKSFDGLCAVQKVLDIALLHGNEARSLVREEVDDSLTKREIEQIERRAGRGAERKYVIEVVEMVTVWLRDLLLTINGAPEAVVNVDFTSELIEDVSLVDSAEIESAIGVVLEMRRRFDLQLQEALTLDAMFVSLRRELARR